MVHITLMVLMLAVPLVMGQGQCPPVYPQCRQQNWHIGADRVQPSGAVVHGHADIHISGGAQANVHGSRVIGGPYSGAQTVGGGVKVEHNGLHGSAGVSHTRGQGNTFSANVGGSTKVGPGTLSVGGGANSVPGSSRVQGQVGATYSVP